MVSVRGKDSQASKQRWWKHSFECDWKIYEWMNRDQMESFETITWQKKILAMLFATISPTMTEIASTYNCIELDDKSKVKIYISRKKKKSIDNESCDNN